MANVAITGGTRGIGLGLAREFLVRGHAVMVSGRDAAAVAARVDELHAEYPGCEIDGCVCNVASIDSVQQMWDATQARFGNVDYWINNAGRNNRKAHLEQLDWAEIENTIDTNLLGLMRGSVVALRGMQAQGGGWIFNMGGFGSEGMIGLDQVPYGVSKYGVRYVTKALVKSVANTPVKVGFLSPGIVTTEMAVPRAENRDEFFDANLNFLNILADHVETVTPWAVERMLAARKNGTVIRWMGLGLAAGRFATSLLRKRRVIEEAMHRLDASNGAAPRNREYENE